MADSLISVDVYTPPTEVQWNCKSPGVLKENRRTQEGVKGGAGLASRDAWVSCAGATESSRL